jgi:DNA-binding FrmR family transcriptional regulator
MPKGIPRDKSFEQKILHRLNIARGHLDHVIRMMDGGAYCIDVVQQSMAVQAALKSADEAILKNHMQTCVAEEVKKGNAKEVIDEIMKVMEKK